MAPGFGGPILFSGEDSPAALQLTGNQTQGLLEFQCTVNNLNLQLGPGRYWLFLRPYIEFLALRTEGDNGVGTPLNNGQSLGYSVFYLLNYASLDTYYNDPSVDFSYRIEGTAVPEPLSAGALALGLLACLKRRR